MRPIVIVRLLAIRPVDEEWLKHQSRTEWGPLWLIGVATCPGVHPAHLSLLENARRGSL